MRLKSRSIRIIACTTIAIVLGFIPYVSSLTASAATDNWSLVSSAGFSSTYVQYSQLVFNGSTPYVVYSEGNKATVMKYDGTN